MYAYRVPRSIMIAPSLVGRRLGPRVINAISHQRLHSFACVVRATSPCVRNARHMGTSVFAVQDHRRFRFGHYRNKDSSRTRTWRDAGYATT